MKILAFTAGAAQMYCGSCLRDNTLAAELRKQGHDIILMPIYTPTRTDEPNVSDSRVFMNGITVCLAGGSQRRRYYSCGAYVDNGTRRTSRKIVLWTSD